MKLSKAQRSQLYNTIIDAYADKNELARVVGLGLNERLELIAPNTDFKHAAYVLLDWAEREGRLTELVSELSNAKPQSTQLHELAE